MSVREGQGEVVIYAEGDKISIEVRLEEENVWLSQRQMGELFGKDVRTVNEHIQNIYKEGELEQDSTIRKFRIVRREGRRKVEREIDFYGLDVIISVGYRIKSRQGTRFRIWANKILKDYLVRGYALNEQRLREQTERIAELRQTLTLFQNVLPEGLNLTEAKGLLQVITDYAQTFVLLNQYDSDRLPAADFNKNLTYEITRDEAAAAITQLKQALIVRKEASPLFGNRKDDSFAGILGNIVQSFGGEYVYPSIEAQAAHLLYFIIKNHPFTDGNKRIGAFLFIWFLQRNRHHLKPDGAVKINDNALTAIALLVAQSDPAQKEIMIRLIMNLIRG